MIKIITCADDMEEVLLGDETHGEELEVQVRMEKHAEKNSAPMFQPIPAMLLKTHSTFAHTSHLAVNRRDEACA